MGTAQSRQSLVQRPKNERGWRALRRTAFKEHTDLQQQPVASQQQEAVVRQQLIASQHQLAMAQQQLADTQQALTTAQGLVPICPICLEQLPSNVVCATYACGHVFCRACAQTQTAANHHECSMCNVIVPWGNVQASHLRLFYQ